mmetsp:Transcript_20615/g.48889  ORF Transcript_20615/g.48889 Transcript_20615/m.48889 type:complete len:229 (+) Transcript_20615:144-830(+)
MSNTTTDATATSAAAAACAAPEAAAPEATANAAAANVFSDEDEMMKQLQAMGMPRQMLENLTSKQKAAMFALTKSPEIQRRAEERVAHDEEWKELENVNDDKKTSGPNFAADEIMWKNTRDDVFCKFTLTKSTAKKEQVQCIISSNHLKVVIVTSNSESKNSSSSKDFDDDPIVAGVVVDRELFQTVDVDESTYKVEEGDDDGNGDALVIVVSLRKKQIPMRWLTVFR